MAENFDLANEVVDFAAGKSVDWDLFSLPIPNGVIIYATDSQEFKKGDGAKLFVDLPVLTSITTITAGAGAIEDVLTLLTGGDEDAIIWVVNEEYVASTTTLTAVNDALAAIGIADTNQDVSLATIATQAALTDQTLSVSNDGELGVIESGIMTTGETAENVVVGAPSTPIHIRDVTIYTDAAMATEAMELNDSETYYVHVDGFHDEQDIDDLTFELVSDADEVITITNVERGIFKAVVNIVAADRSVVFTSTCSYLTDTISRDQSVDILINKDILMAVYGGTEGDYVYSVVTDSQNNIILVGSTNSEGAGIYSTLIVKFDSKLDIIFSKTYGGSSSEYFYGVTVDSQDNIICAGYTFSEGVSNEEALVVKFNSSLNILARKSYGSATDDRFYNVITDSAGNIICVGRTDHGAVGLDDALVVKFDSSLNLILSKVYGGTEIDWFNGVAVDSQDNIICAGWTRSEGIGNDALVVKFDANLNILIRKIYGGTGSDYFYGVTVDSQDNIICAGNTASEGINLYSTLVVRFSPSLSILARKVYGGSGNEYFYEVAVDSQDNIICVGMTYSEGDANGDALVIKFDSLLNILAKKIYGGNYVDYFHGVAVDSQDNIICAGVTSSEGVDSYDGLVIKLPSIIPSGTFVGTILTGIILRDSNLTLADSNLALADSNLTLNTSTLTLADSNLTLADSNLTLEKDTIPQ